jgi:hypothetical protein
VSERGSRACLAFETCQSSGIGGHVVREHLDRHLALEFEVAGAVDLSHAARSERGKHFEATEARSWGERHRFLDSAGGLIVPAPRGGLKRKVVVERAVAVTS